MTRKGRKAARGVKWLPLMKVRTQDVVSDLVGASGFNEDRGEVKPPNRSSPPRSPASNPRPPRPSPPDAGCGIGALCGPPSPPPADAERPRRTYWTLETMPWMYPDDPESYVRLLDAIDRPACAAHFDPVNWVSSPQQYFATADLVRAGVRALGPRIRSVHVKDITIADRLMVHLDEVRPGLGSFDHATLLRELATLDADLPVMLEHLPTQEEYAEAAAHLRRVAEQVGVGL